MEQRLDGAKKPLGTLSPRELLKRGWNGVVSTPLTVIKDSINSVGMPNSLVVIPTSRMTLPSPTEYPSRMTLPSPTEYPSLFDVRNPSSTRLADGTTIAGRTQEVGQLMPQFARESVSANWCSNPTNFINRTCTDEEMVNGKAAEEQTYCQVYHHNLYSVLTNPKASKWGGTLLDALYPSLDVDIALSPYPGLADVSIRDLQPYLRQFGMAAAKYEENHLKPVNEQLSSSNVPSISVADEDVAKCLKAVPTLFFEPGFDLANPKMFEEVMTMPHATSIQEELTTYLDRVEFTLLRQVSSRSDRFFEASADQEVIKQSIKAACDQVATLRVTMKRLRNLLADKTLDIVSLHRRQKRIKELHNLVAMIEEVRNAEAAVEALVQCQDYTNALTLIETSQVILKENLQSIHGLSSLHDKFRGYRGLISSQISQRFISIVTSHKWAFHDKEESALSSNKSQNSLSDAKVHVQEEITQLVDVLFRVDALDITIKSYYEQLNEEIRIIVKTVVTETIAVSLSSKSGGNSDFGASLGNESKISNQLRALTSDEFLQCVQMIFDHLLMVLKRTTVVQSILVNSMQNKKNEATEEEKVVNVANRNESCVSLNEVVKCKAANSSEGWSPLEHASDEHTTLSDWKIKAKCSKVIREIDEVVRKTCELSQRSVSNLFAVRKEVQAVYTMPQLRKLYDTTMDFVVSVEKLMGKTDYTLRGSLFSQLKLFLEKYHQIQVARLVSTLDHELWKNTEISEPRHKALDDLSSGRGVALLLSNDREITGETAPPRKMVSICGKTFRVVWSVLLMLEITMNYMSCAANFPVLASDVLQRSIEIFRLYNSRTTQLVLGAGAMQIANLKSISARHLALASQSLELSMTIIPHIKAALAAHFTDRQKLLLDEFDRVSRDYAEHNEKIFSKFTSIVEEQIMNRFLENISTQIDYDCASLTIPTNPMRGITQSTLKLYAVLKPILSPPQMKDVMSRVFDMFTQKLPECFKLVQPRTSVGKERVVDDIGAFVQSFHEVTEHSFDGCALLRHFNNAYSS
ncbi:vacuolar protein sorting-associated [Plasmopara halstedii]|uniref:Vacuolar protein sorting-associated protein 54 n=1 Tax=Plasmopara halstedii TaxID=4781 RepID=A0A0P1AJR9_PLAHL|nr:vacuolar protein sorting-associated [Plasmopara halstedii]CEG41093.1 vacuolar protein sorting-associated [Plasmopara halstedii]|eukprot:XP_024577462.1 vacuolar protein sorting-associated [Plasmopara halstedii]